MSVARLLVLGAVRILQPVHGYDVRRELLSWHVDNWAHIAPGSIYNQLKVLHRDGMLEIVDQDRSEGRPAKTSYQLTNAGEIYFVRILHEAWWQVSDDPVMLTAAVSFMSTMARDELIAALENRITQLDALARQLSFGANEVLAGRWADAPPHIAESFWLGQTRLTAEQQWARSLRERLIAGEYTTAGEWQPEALA